MQFLIRAYAGEGKLDKRMEVRPRHLEGMKIKKGPGTDYDRVQFCPPGFYTIVTTSSGAWASLWGKLKSGIGWLSLDFCQRV